VLRLIKYIFFVFFFLSFSFPSYSQQLLTPQEAASAFKEAISLYKQKRFSQSLIILGEIRNRAPEWRVGTVEKYITKCDKMVKGKREEKLNNTQDNWLDLLTSEEYDQPVNAPVEVLFTEYKDLRTRLEDKKVRLKYLGNQLKKLQTDSVFKIKNLEQKDSVAKGKIQTLETKLFSLSKKVQELEDHKKANLKKLKDEWETKIKESATLIDKKDLELSLLEEKTKHLTTVVKEAKSLKEENDLLIRQIEKLREKIKTPKIIYKPDPKQRETIDKLTQRSASLEDLSQRVTKDNQSLTDNIKKTKEELKTLSAALEIKNKEIIRLKDAARQLEIETDKIKASYASNSKQQEKINQQSKRIKILESLNQEILNLNKKVLGDLKVTQEKLKKSEDSLREEKDKSQLKEILLKNKTTDIQRLDEKIKELNQNIKASPEIKETIIYKASPQQEKIINSLSKEINRINETTINDLKEMESKLKEKDAVIKRLKHILSTVYSRIESLSN